MTKRSDPVEVSRELAALAKAGDLARMEAFFEELSYQKENAFFSIQSAALEGHADCVAFLIPHVRHWGMSHSPPCVLPPRVGTPTASGFCFPCQTTHPTIRQRSGRLPKMDILNAPPSCFPSRRSARIPAPFIFPSK